LIVGTKQDPAAALAMANTETITRTTSAISSGSKHNATEHMIQQPSSPVDLLGMPSPTAAANGNATFQTWDAFADDDGTAVGVPQVSSPSPQKQQWTAFGGDKANGAAHQATAPPPVQQQQQQQQGEVHTWEAFGDAPSVAQVPATPAPPPPAVAPVAHHPEQQQPPSPLRPPPPPPPLPVVHRAEVPLDIFYPEFEQIRATGVLPTGQRLPGYYPAAPPPVSVAVARSPASSSYLSFPLPVAQGQGQRQVAAGANPISNSSSMNGRTGEADPFANLSTGFKAALPPSPQYQPSVAPVMPVVAAAPSNAYSAPISSASTTLYGSQRQQPSSQYIGYDLTAPAAAKAKSSGNPFA